MMWSLITCSRNVGEAAEAFSVWESTTFQSAASSSDASVLPYHTTTTRPALPHSSHGIRLVWNVGPFTLTLSLQVWAPFVEWAIQMSCWSDQTQ